MERNEIEVEISFKGKKIKIRGNSLKTIFSQIDETVSKSMENILTNIEPTEPAITTDSSFDSLIKSLKPKSFYDKILTCIYYLNTRGVSIFNQEDLKKAFIDARFPQPKNVVDLLNKLTEKGFVAEHNEKKNDLKAWYITQEGLKYVNEGFDAKEVD